MAFPVYDFGVRGRPSRRGCLFWWVGSRLLPLSHLFAEWNRRISGPFHFSSKTSSTKAFFTLSSKVLPSFWGVMASPAARSRSPVICRASGLVKSKNPRPTPIRIFSTPPSDASQMVRRMVEKARPVRALAMPLVGQSHGVYWSNGQSPSLRQPPP